MLRVRLRLDARNRFAPCAVFPEIRLFEPISGALSARGSGAPAGIWEAGGDRGCSGIPPGTGQAKTPKEKPCPQPPPAAGGAGTASPAPEPFPHPSLTPFSCSDTFFRILFLLVLIIFTPFPYFPPPKAVPALPSPRSLGAGLAPPALRATPGRDGGFFYLLFLGFFLTKSSFFFFFPPRGDPAGIPPRLRLPAAL